MTARLQKATRQHTKTHNSRLVLQTIYEHGTLSRADLARMTALTRATVSEVTADLIRRGLVGEVGQGPTSIGRTPTLLSVLPDSHQVVGIDIAESELRGALVNLHGEIRERIVVPLADRSGDALVNLVYDTIDTLVRHATSPLLGIGVGTPGLVDPISGEIREAVNFGLHNTPLRAYLQTRYDMPVHVENDCHLAALAEYTFGRWPQADNIVVLLVRRGIGAGIILNGQLISGDGGGAGEVGHLMIVENGRPCLCGNTGCLETVASNRALIERARQIGRDEPQSLLRRSMDTGDELTLASLRQAVQADDPIARQVIDEAGYYLGAAVAQIIAILNIRRVLIAGQVKTFGRVLLDMIRQAMHTRSLDLLAQATEIDFASLDSDVVLLGATAKVLTSELGLVRPDQRVIAERQPLPDRKHAPRTDRATKGGIVGQLAS